MKELNKSIKCDVQTCKYQNYDYCTLDKVKISCNCNNEECLCKEDTICDSYKEKK